MEEESFDIDSSESILNLKGKIRSKIKNNSLVSNQPTWPSRYKCFQAYIWYVMSYISAIKFCRRLGNYKATIFIPYLLCIIFIGVPGVLVEIMLGRFVMGNLSMAWSMCVPTEGVFWCLVCVTFYSVILNYIYNIYLLKYLFSSFYGEWEKCNKPWNKINCYRIGWKSQAVMKCLKNNSVEFCHNLKWETAGMQFWKYRIQDTTDKLEVFVSFLFLVLTVILIFVFIFKGILSLERVLTLFLYPSMVLWALLVIVSFSAPNSVNGLKALFSFSWNDLIRPQMWVDGFEDMLYFVGVGRLSLSFISSHGNFTDNILLDVAIVIFVSLTSNLLITTPILTIIANIKFLDQGSTDEPFFNDITDVIVTISEALLFYPYPAYLWSALYYLDCYLVSVSSQAVLVLALCKALEGVINKKKSFFYIILAVSIVSFVAAGFCQFIEFIRNIDLSSVIVVMVVLCTISWQWFYGVGKFNYDYLFMMGYPLPLFLRFTWITLFILPIVEITVKVYYRATPMNNLFVYFGTAIVIYTLVILIYIVKFRVKKEKISKVFMANPNWGPENALLKKSRVFFEKSFVTREFIYRQELYKKPFVKPPDFSEQNIVNLI